MPEVKCGPGVNPLDPNAAEQFKQQAETISKKYDPETIGNLTTLNDLHDQPTMMGKPCRPLSAGLITVLEEINHPLFSNQTKVVGDYEDDVVYGSGAIVRKGDKWYRSTKDQNTSSPPRGKWVKITDAEVEEAMGLDISMKDMLVLLWLITGAEDEMEIIDAAESGNVNRAAMAWAFTLDQEWTNGAILEAQAMIMEYEEAADTYAPTGGDADEKKPSATG